MPLRLRWSFFLLLLCPVVLPAADVSSDTTRGDKQR